MHKKTNQIWLEAITLKKYINLHNDDNIDKSLGQVSL